jgi:hypothetical protein
LGRERSDTPWRATVEAYFRTIGEPEPVFMPFPAEPFCTQRKTKVDGNKCGLCKCPKTSSAEEKKSEGEMDPLIQGFQAIVHPHPSYLMPRRVKKSD